MRLAHPSNTPCTLNLPYSILEFDAHFYIYIYVYMRLCVCVCLCVRMYLYTPQHIYYIYYILHLRMGWLRRLLGHLHLPRCDSTMSQNRKLRT